MQQFFSGQHEDGSWRAIVCADFESARSAFGKHVHPIVSGSLKPDREDKAVWDSPGIEFRRTFGKKSGWIVTTDTGFDSSEHQQRQAVANVYFTLGRCVDIVKAHDGSWKAALQAQCLEVWSEIYYLCIRSGAGHALATKTTDETLLGTVAGRLKLLPSEVEKAFAAAFLQCLVADHDFEDPEY